LAKLPLASVRRLISRSGRTPTIWMRTMFVAPQQPYGLLRKMFPSLEASMINAPFLRNQLTSLVQSSFG